jgi:hypothetical protein
MVIVLDTFVFEAATASRLLAPPNTAFINQVSFVTSFPMNSEKEVSCCSALNLSITLRCVQRDVCGRREEGRRHVILCGCIINVTLFMRIY